MNDSNNERKRLTDAETNQVRRLLRVGRPLTALISHPVFRFFYPQLLPSDAVSRIYVSSFRWTFFTTLVIGSVIYFVVGVDDPAIQEHMAALFSLIGRIAPRDHPLPAHGDINGLFFLVLAVSALFFFARRVKDIPPDYCDLGDLRTFGMLCSVVLFFPAMALVIAIGAHLETAPSISVGNVLRLLLFSFLYGFMSVNFVRFLLVVSLVGGWRITNNSIFNRNRTRYKGRPDQ